MSLIENIFSFSKEITETNFLKEGYPLRRVNSFGDSTLLRRKHNVSITDIINLAGGVPNPDITLCEIKLSCVDEDIIGVYIEYRRKQKRIAHVSHRIDFERKVIHGNLIEVFGHHKEKGISTNLLVNQVRAAIMNKFERIEMIAGGGVNSGNEPPNKIFQGYYHWPKYGFIMDAESEQKFGTWLDEHNRKENTIYDLLNSSEGLEYFKTNGNSWTGYFDLRKKSFSLLTLKEYLKKKKLRVLVDEDLLR